MKVAKQILTGFAILALAIVLVDCNKNLQEVLEEQVSRLVVEPQQANNTAEARNTTPTTETASAADNQEAQPKRDATPTKTTPTTNQASKLNTEQLNTESFVVYSEGGEQKKSEDQEAVLESKSSKQGAPSKKAKAKKYKVITIRIPDDSEPQPDDVAVEANVTTMEASAADAVDEQKEAKVAKKEEPKPTEEGELEARSTSVPPQKKSLTSEGKVASNKHETKNKSGSKKSKGDTKKRDKRETKKSGSGKNGKTKRSTEKSKKYENKKKSKK